MVRLMLRWPFSVQFNCGGLVLRYSPQALHGLNLIILYGRLVGFVGGSGKGTAPDHGATHAPDGQILIDGALLKPAVQRTRQYGTHVGKWACNNRGTAAADRLSARCVNRLKPSSSGYWDLGQSHGMHRDGGARWRGHRSDYHNGRAEINDAMALCPNRGVKVWSHRTRNCESSWPCNACEST